MSPQVHPILESSSYVSFSMQGFYKSLQSPSIVKSSNWPLYDSWLSLLYASIFKTKNNLVVRFKKKTTCKCNIKQLASVTVGCLFCMHGLLPASSGQPLSHSSFPIHSNPFWGGCHVFIVIRTSKGLLETLIPWLGYENFFKELFY